MRALLSTIGSRGDVQPLVALALELKALGQDVLLCVPPDFREWIENLGLPVTPIGPELRTFNRESSAAKPGPPSTDQLRQMVDDTVATQFETIAAAARGCDVIVGATALQIAAHSVAEKLRIPYVFVAYCPTVLPSPQHAPPPLGMLGQSPAAATADNRELWIKNAERSNATFGAALNAHRAILELPPIGDVRHHIFTEQPWLAADTALGPWPESADAAVFQTGAWILKDERALSPELEAFLETGEPPVYFGFGSMRAPRDLGQSMLQAARALGRRAIVARGWAELSSASTEADFLSIGEVNQQALFARVAAIVHHGGAGTTTAAALAGAPQVVVPQMYDQHYWAERTQQLGIGTAHAPGIPSAESLISALTLALAPPIVSRAKAFAPSVSRAGASVAARRLVALSQAS